MAPPVRRSGPAGTERSFGTTRVVLERGDITDARVDAIVNAANSSLMGGGGVDGAIHRRGGPAILAACREIRAARGSLPTGEAVATTAGDLPARWVVHTVGPVWMGGAQREDQLLASAWRRSLEVAVGNGARTVAFPSISTGAYDFPVDRAARIGLGVVAAFCAQRPGDLDEVRVVLFSDADLATYERALSAL